ncbi:uncharacterized protein JCM6883_000195 [Sporobolomyces salmoneus]|uniref:uncharacterized protein n=1 Tax=Sporobolomyces salmoneus TaxID=183962 RepID=UPI003172C2C9
MDVRNREYKVVVLGGGGVGKSALTVRFVHSLFVEKYDPTIEDSYRRTINVDGITVALEVLDTAGTEQFMSLHHMYIKSGDGFLLVFSLTSLESVSELFHLREQIQRIKDASNTSGLPQKVPIVLVGSKLDLINERQVKREVAVQLSQSWGGVPYYETSSRKEINIEEVFADITRQMIKAEQLTPQYQRRRNNLNGLGGDDTNARAGGKGGRRRRCTIL